ncbi:dienelactone hydrolase family protein [Gluconacetobacter azotocaptans]|uniref:Dienelactone hydrolase family protein n=1 Tax=Gluconacetobacter azotocaptans TaxID=142834 RepID=A0A7W4PG97_9PROT|nr:dienelactone hydrolase family protein [Gluconacetobacter azotocaptans]MBB2189781.1 dienelactone hydrolase family protein [Gluconacetobacter azotocaptans]MBM9402212.1 dienelactone hydrolase family protein [Gluconacetobacter azotocaptans]GBQ37733.1 carboxymethylenebutenolidase [Gluconacetobacter azotocaptans DSM 13594]
MGTTITLTASDGHTLSAYMAGAPDAPRALVVVQEIFGVNHHIRAVCDEFAADGYRVVAPALFDRAERDVELAYDAQGVQTGLRLRAAIPPDRTLLDVMAAANALNDGKVGIIGYCWGGTVAWMAAARTRAFAAAVGWYGGGIAAQNDLVPHCPVQLHFGETDGSIPLSDVAAIRAAHPDVEILTYPHAGHGFGCSERDSFNAAATQLARTRSLAFLARHL